MPTFTASDGTKVETEVPAYITDLKARGYVEGTKTDANTAARRNEKALTASIDPIVVTANPEDETPVQPEAEVADPGANVK